jgi:hypothetical protein
VEKRLIVKSSFDFDDISAEQKRLRRRETQARGAEAAEIAARARRILAAADRAALREKRDRPTS